MIGLSETRYEMVAIKGKKASSDVATLDDTFKTTHLMGMNSYGYKQLSKIATLDNYLIPPLFKFRHCNSRKIRG